MLVVIVGFGSLSDPYTCSTHVPQALKDEPEKILINVCIDKGLDADTVDELLVIDGTGAGIGIKQYTRAAEHFT